MTPYRNICHRLAAAALAALLSSAGATAAGAAPYDAPSNARRPAAGTADSTAAVDTTAATAPEDAVSARIDSLRAALAATEKLNQARSADLGDALCELSGLYVRVGDYARADSVSRRALEVRRELYGDADPRVAEVLADLGAVRDAARDYAGAVPCYRRALAIERAQPQPDEKTISGHLRDLAAVLAREGAYAQAVRRQDEALRLLSARYGPDHLYCAVTRLNMAAPLIALGRTARAESCLVDALAVLRRATGEHGDMTARAELALGELYTTMGRYRDATRLLSDALESFRVLYGGSHPLVAAAHLDLAELARTRGRDADAVTKYDRAITIYRGLIRKGSDDPRLALALTGRGRAQIAQRHYEAAVSSLEESARVHAFARRRASFDELRRPAATERSSPYLYLAAAEVARGRPAAAFAAVERDRMRAMIALTLARSRRDLPSAERERERALDRRLAHLEAALAGADDPLASKTVALRRRYEAARAQWTAFEKALGDHYPLISGTPFDLDRIQAVLHRDEAIIGWLDADAAHYAWALRATGPVTFVPIPAPDHTITALRGALPGWGTFASIDAPAVARAVFAARVAPLAPALEGVTHLVVVPSGPMQDVPVEALPTTDGTFVGKRYVVSYAPSASMLAWLRGRKAPAAEGTLLAVGGQGMALRRAGDALIAPTDPPDARAELALITQAFPQVTVLTGRRATEHALSELARSDGLFGFRTIHLAVRAVADRTSDALSAFDLAPADSTDDPLADIAAGLRPDDGEVTMDEVLREWALDAEVVTLSVCHGLRYDTASSDGCAGFANAFLTAGARSLVVSLCYVPERPRSLLLNRFYENLRDRGMGAADALADARARLRAFKDFDGRTPYASPAFWAAFVLYGDPGRG